MCALACKYARARASPRQHLSPLFPDPLAGGWGQKLQSFTLASLSPAFIMTPTFFFLILLDSILLIPFLSLLPHPSSLCILKYNQECRKLEGDLVLGLSQGGGGRRTLGFSQAWGRGSGPTPPGSHEMAFQVPGPLRSPSAHWLRPMGFMQSNSQTPSLSAKKTFLPVTTE